MEILSITSFLIFLKLSQCSSGAVHNTGNDVFIVPLHLVFLAVIFFIFFFLVLFAGIFAGQKFSKMRGSKRLFWGIEY
jgi:hypothetical protein